MFARLLAILALFVAFAGAPQPLAAQEKPLTVFAAASMKNALDDANAAFSKATGIKVVASYAASSALAKQIEQGAPADVFVSADLKWMDYVAEHKLIKPDTRVNLLGNRLVLIAPKDSKLDTVDDRPRASTSPSSPATAASRSPTSRQCRPGFTPRRRCNRSAHGRRPSRNWRRPKTCARRSLSWRAARRRSASFTRPTPRSSRT